MRPAGSVHAIVPGVSFATPSPILDRPAFDAVKFRSKRDRLGVRREMTRQLALRRRLHLDIATAPEARNNDDAESLARLRNVN